ncbi:MAG: DUF2070 family protein [Candidatus Undinarchaeales archaeon]
MTRFLFVCPSTGYLILYLLAASAFFSLFTISIFTKIQYFTFLFLPAVVSAILSDKLVTFLGGELKTKHSFFIYAFALTCLSLLLTISSYLFSINPYTIIFISLSLLSVLYLTVFRSISYLKIHKGILPSLFYPLFSLILLNMFAGVSFSQFVDFALLLSISFVLTSVFLYLINAPFRKTIGVPTTDLVALIFGEYITGFTPRNAFKYAAKTKTVPYQEIRFSGKGKNYLFTIPWLHPGPLGTVGGNLPVKLKEKFNKTNTDSVFFHTYVDHSLDPVFSEKAASTIFKKKAEKSIISKKGTKFKLIKKSSKKAGTVTLLGQKIGEFYLFISSFAPSKTEDVSYLVGSKFLKELDEKAILIDAHNSCGSSEESIYNINPGDPKAKLLSKAITELKDELDKQKQHEIEISVSSDSASETLLKSGIREISAVIFEINKQKICFIVLDANNIPSDFRKSLTSKIKEKGVDICEIITTDAHLGKLAMKTFGETGKGRREELTSIVFNLIEEASKNLNKSNATYNFKRVDVDVLGEEIFKKLIKIGNKVIFRAKLTLFTLFCIFFISVYLLFF